MLFIKDSLYEENDSAPQSTQSLNTPGLNRNQRALRLDPDDTDAEGKTLMDYLIAS